MVGNWWATVWSSAVETDAFHDTSQVAPGASLARRQELGSVEVEPGSATLRGDTWVAQLGIRQFDDPTWETIWTNVAGDALQSAAVLTGDLPPEIFGLATGSGISLTPTSGDLLPDCTCSDWHEPCKHVGALCALITRMIEVDPWVFMLLRGRSRNRIVDQVRAMRASARGTEPSPTSDEPRGSDPGAAAAAAFRHDPAPLPLARPLLRRPVPAVAIEPAPPADSGLEANELRRLVADAAMRATQLLNGEQTSGLSFTPAQDLARMACQRWLNAEPLGALADMANVAVDDLERAAVAWSVGGPAGLSIAEDRHEVEELHIRRADEALQGGTRSNGNSVTKRNVQLRIDRDGLWWRFDAHHRLGWILAAGGFAHPADALS